jgi:hypothetical protein
MSRCNSPELCTKLRPGAKGNVKGTACPADLGKESVEASASSEVDDLLFWEDNLEHYPSASIAYLHPRAFLMSRISSWRERQPIN